MSAARNVEFKLPWVPVATKGVLSLPERALCRFVIGPTNIHVDSDFVHRLSILIKIVDEVEGSATVNQEQAIG